jgi:actin-like ATPase involved in cell morphogenesis
MDSSFVAALTEAVNGIKKFEECAGLIVSTALDDVLLRIAQDYNLDFSKLVTDYKDDIVEAHTILTTGKQACKGLTIKKNKCSRQAVAGGYCRAHAQQGIEKKELDKKGVDYANSQTNKKEQDPIAVALKRLDIKTEDPRVFKVSKSEITDFF